MNICVVMVVSCFLRWFVKKISHLHSRWFQANDGNTINSAAHSENRTTFSKVHANNKVASAASAENSAATLTEESAPVEESTSSEESVPAEEFTN